MNNYLISNRKLTLIVAAAFGTMAPAMAQKPTEAKPAQDTPATPAAPATEAPATPPPPVVSPEAMKQDSSYGFGFQTGRRFAGETMQYGIKADDIQREAFIKGFFEAIEGKDPSVAEEKIGAAMQALGNALQEREKKLADVNLAAGKEFLAANKGKEGVITTPSGLQYKIITKGEGESYQEPKAGEKAVEKQFMVHYTGTLVDGTKFDASPEGQPVPMPLQVIPGFQEALKMMKVGSEWQLWIPADLAYGAERRSAEIGPNQVLIFNVKLVGIQDAPPAQGMQFPGMPGGEMPMPE